MRLAKRLPRRLPFPLRRGRNSASRRSRVSIPNFTVLSDVSTIGGNYGRTAWEERTETLFPERAIRYVNAPWTYTLTATDLDSAVATLVYSLVSPAVGDGVSFSGGTLTWTAAISAARTFVVRATDSAGSFSEQTFTIASEANRVGAAPTITSVPTGPVTLGETFAYQVVAFDPNGDPLTYALFGAGLPTISIGVRDGVCMSGVMCY